jgi:hypothetical protein
MTEGGVPAEHADEEEKEVYLQNTATADEEEEEVYLQSTPGPESERGSATALSHSWSRSPSPHAPTRVLPRV